MIMTADQRKQKAKTIIQIAATSSSTLVGIIPFGDQVVLPSVLVVMVSALADLFEIKVSREDALKILKSLTGNTVGKQSAQHLLGLMPGVGVLANLSVSFGIIEAIGWRIYEYFEKQVQPNEPKTEKTAEPRMSTSQI